MLVLYIIIFILKFKFIYDICVSYLLKKLNIYISQLLKNELIISSYIDYLSYYIEHNICLKKTQ